MWWSVVSPFKPYGPLIALIFVVGVAAIKAIIEDRKRHQEDAFLNNSTAHVMEPDGAVPHKELCDNTLLLYPVLAVHHAEMVSEWCHVLCGRPCSVLSSGLPATQCHGSSAVAPCDRRWAVWSLQRGPLLRFANHDKMFTTLPHVPWALLVSSPCQRVVEPASRTAA